MKHAPVRVLLLVLVLVSGALTACQPTYTLATVTPVPTDTAIPAASPTPLPPTAEPTTTPTEVPPTIAPTIEPTTEAATPIAEQPAAEVPVAALPADRGEFFTGSGACAVCHVNMTDQNGVDVSLDAQWRSSMMANAGRDPYWQAGVRSETIANPGYADFIQDKCTTCHMPMARFTEYARDAQGVLLDDAGFLNPDHDLHTLAMDGVSCSLCHQIEPDGFGELVSYSGHYAIDTRVPTGERPAYGPYAVTETNAVLMQGSTGLIPTEGLHVQESELCGTCHTLYTPTIDANGETVGEFPEQMVYLEWRNSAYSTTNSCQDCHMPVTDGGVVLSITGGEPRSPFNQHVFVGANVYTPDLIYRYGEELGSPATRAQVDATINATLAQLQNNTATLSLGALTQDGGDLVFDVTVTSQTGHKLPSSYPSRRAWLHVTVTDAAGQVVFESGAANPDGAIVGNDNDADPALFEPHYDTISAPDEVQIYEAIMSDVAGLPTTTLLNGAGYLKDNRLLPDGFDKATVPDDIAVWGAARDDANFTAGSDQVTYRVPVGDAGGPYTVTVELRYQSIAYRWAYNLSQRPSEETERFLAYYTDTPSPAVLITSSEASPG